MDSKILHSFASQHSPVAWRDLLISSVKQSQFGEVRLPTFPDSALQSLFVGSSNEHAMLEGFNFYSAILKYLDRVGKPLNPESKVLDFGCGWGRYMRYFYRDVLHKNLYGVDPWHLAIDTCRETGVHGQLMEIDLLPPTIFADNTFDLVFAYSVFSHLSPMASEKWIAEITRLLKPGGVVCVTTQGRTFIDYCASLRGKPPESVWHEYLQRSFPEPEQMYRRYDDGEFLYAPNGGGPALPSEIYGDAIVPRGHVEKIWCRHLNLINFVDDRSYLPQALVVMQK
jgi:SAM-dependent methyltransferase